MVCKIVDCLWRANALNNCYLSAERLIQRFLLKGSDFQQHNFAIKRYRYATEISFKFTVIDAKHFKIKLPLADHKLPRGHVIDLFCTEQLYFDALY